MMVIRIRLKVEQKNKAQFVQYMIEETQRNKNRQGCMAYSLYEDLALENQFLLYEEWQDEHSFDLYKASVEFNEIMQKLSPLLSEKPDSAHFSSNLVGP